jgi:hypothetical protein
VSVGDHVLEEKLAQLRKVSLVERRRVVPPGMLLPPWNCPWWGVTGAGGSIDEIDSKDLKP